MVEEELERLANAAPTCVETAPRGNEEYVRGLREKTLHHGRILQLVRFEQLSVQFAIGSNDLLVKCAPCLTAKRRHEGHRQQKRACDETHRSTRGHLSPPSVHSPSDHGLSAEHLDKLQSPRPRVTGAGFVSFIQLLDG